MTSFKQCALAVACAEALSISVARAQGTQDPSTAPPGPRGAVIEHVLVTTPLHKETAETALPFTVLTGSELRRSVGATIGDTLSNMPGVSNASFGPGVGQPVIRGQQGPRVRVLQNGTTSADASKASQDHANAVEALLANSIEVLRGPSTLLYGGGAIGGVVNVLDNRIPTAMPEEPAGSVGYRHDTASNMDVLVGKFEGGVGNFAFHVDAMTRDFDDLEIPGMAALDDDHMHEGEDHDDHDDHDDDHGDEHGDEEAPNGIVPNTAGEASSFTFGSSYHFDSGFVGLSVSRLDNEYGLPEGSHDHAHDDEHEGEEHEGEDHDHDEEEEEGGILLDMKQTRYDALVHWHDLVPGIEVARGFLTYTDYEHAEIEGNGEVGTLYANESLEGRLELVHKNFAGFDGVVGLQTSAGEFSALGEEAFIPTTDYEEFGLFLVEDYHTENWIFELGLRYDTEQRDPSTIAGSQRFNAFSGALSGLWQVANDWQLGLAVSRSERAPSIEELYSNVGNDFSDLVIHAATSAYEIGNPDLDTEVSRNVDLSLRWTQGGHYASVQLYYNEFDDFINLVNTGLEIDEDPVRAFEQSDAEFMGIEFDSEFTVGEFAGGSVYLGFFGDVTQGELANGDDVPRLPPLRLGARLGWESDRLSFWTRVLDAAEQDRPGANESETAAYTRWDAGADYRLDAFGQGFELFVTLNNITDEEIRLSTSFLRDVAPEQGFGMEAGLRVNF